MAEENGTNKRFLTIREASRVLGLSYPVAWDLLTSMSGMCRNLGKSTNRKPTWRVDRVALEDFIESRKNKMPKSLQRQIQHDQER